MSATTTTTTTTTAAAAAAIAMAPFLPPSLSMLTCFTLFSRSSRCARRAHCHHSLCNNVFSMITLFATIYLLWSLYLQQCIYYDHSLCNNLFTVITLFATMYLLGWSLSLSLQQCIYSDHALCNNVFTLITLFLHVQVRRERRISISVVLRARCWILFRVSTFLFEAHGRTAARDVGW
jgi:hypothetical protein